MQGQFGVHLVHPALLLGWLATASGTVVGTCHVQTPLHSRRDGHEVSAQAKEERISTQEFVDAGEHAQLVTFKSLAQLQRPFVRQQLSPLGCSHMVADGFFETIAFFLRVRTVDCHALERVQIIVLDGQHARFLFCNSLQLFPSFASVNANV